MPQGSVDACAVVTCDAPVHSRGYCKPHYDRAANDQLRLVA